MGSCGSAAARGGAADVGAGMMVGTGAEAGGAEEVAPGAAVDMALSGGRVARCVRSRVISCDLRP